MISGRVTRRKVSNVGAEVARRLLEAAVEANQARAHDDDDEADAEHDVGDQQRFEAELEGADQEEEGEQRRPHHHLWGRHRDHDQEVRQAPAEELVTDQGQRHHRPDDGRDHRRQQRQFEAGHQRFVQFGTAEGVGPVVEGEADPGVVVAARRIVEGEEQDHRDRQQQVDHHQRRDDVYRVLAQPAPGAGAAPLAHRASSPISASEPAKRM
jgi:hypothetical protein